MCRNLLSLVLALSNSNGKGNTAHPIEAPTMITAISPFAVLHYYPAKRLAGMARKMTATPDSLQMPNGFAITPGQVMTRPFPMRGNSAMTRTVEIIRITPAKVFFLLNGRRCPGATHLDYYLLFGWMSGSAY